MLLAKIKEIFLHYLYGIKIILMSKYNNPVVKALMWPYDKFIKSSLKKAKPLFGMVIMFGLTYKCQCKCSHCGSVFYRKEGRRELDRDEIFNLIDDLRRLGAVGLYLFGGEPLLLPDFLEYIRFAKKRGYRGVKFDTNGLLLDENMVKDLKDIGIPLHVGISIDTPREKEHDSLRGVEGIFKKAIEGAKYCVKHSVPCYISAYATRENLQNGDFKKIIELAKSLKVATRFLTTICIGKLLDREDLIFSQEEISEVRGLLEKNRVFWEYIDEKKSPFLCPPFMKYSFYITPYGDIQPCCYMPKVFGNIRKEPLMVILDRMWGSELYKIQKTFNDCPANIEAFRGSFDIPPQGHCRNLNGSKHD